MVPALPNLANSLSGTSVEAFWAGTSYLLSNAICLPFIGLALDIFGRWSMHLFSVFMFTLGKVTCCASSNFTQLIIGRTAQGVGGGGIFALELIIVTNIIPLRQRAKYRTLLVASYGLGGVFGPLVAGVDCRVRDLEVLGFVMIPFVVDMKEEKSEQTTGKKLARLDWIGGLLFIAGTSSFLSGLTWGGVQYGWNTLPAWLPILLGGPLIAASLIYEALVPPEPFLRLSLFKGMSATVIFSTDSHRLYTQLYYLPPIFAGVVLMISNVILSPIGVVSGYIMMRLGAFLWTVRTGFALMALGNGLLLLVNQDMSLVKRFFIFFVSAVGLGFLLSSLTIATQAIARSEDVTFAASTLTLWRSFSMCLGVVIGGRPEAQLIAQNSEACAYVRGFHGIVYVVLCFTYYTMNQTRESDQEVEEQVEPRKVVANT
ncbi:major facilitator superfamily domain-containing protein [Podospora didyma]|uniref:Major facilitator superfamily domain-containing protein n=1 Tax=Podospora didyma TaxID=330526 RepID=A0AAE0K6M0_9PEZI|nr:major facilitator superfamily domain-containing protein [Podospora didyma]